MSCKLKVEELSTGNYYPRSLEKQEITVLGRKNLKIATQKIAN